MSRFYWIFSLCFFFACASGGTETNSKPVQIQSNQTAIKLTATTGKTNIHSGDTATIYVDELQTYHNIQLQFQGQNISFTHGQQGTLKFRIPESNYGECLIQLKVADAQNHEGKKFIRFMVLPEKEPVHVQFDVVKKYPHNTTYYTQGLQWVNGLIYESTGNWQHSKMLKYDLQNQKVVSQAKLPGRVFGEGSVKVGGHVYQLTWTDRIIYKYRAEDLSLVQQYQSNYREGWGLTFDGKYLIMSDGSNRLYYLDTVNFLEVKAVEVYDHLGAVRNINELEYVDGLIYANIYYTDFVVAIDPTSGAVVKKMDCSNLLQAQDKHSTIDVLNGIAYRDDFDHFLLTGKHWPFMYEIKIKH